MDVRRVGSQQNAGPLCFEERFRASQNPEFRALDVDFKDGSEWQFLPGFEIVKRGRRHLQRALFGE
jgi:hypothetical protein